MNDDLYHVVEIDGKGLGCVATKDVKMGNVILRETPELPICLANEAGRIIWSPKSVMDLLAHFNSMNQNDQTEYLSLYDKFDYLNVLPLEQKLELEKCLEERKMLLSHIEQTKDKAEKILKIFNIYEPNSFEGGVCIKLSRFNHSCRPNAFTVITFGSQIGMCIFSTI